MPALAVFILFQLTEAIVNTDFAEDTVDGKSTTHGTITAVCQKASAPGEPVAHNLEICEAHSLSVIMYPYKREHEFKVNSGGVAESYQLNTHGWLIASAVSRSTESELQVKIPG